MDLFDLLNDIYYDHETNNTTTIFLNNNYLNNDTYLNNTHLDNNASNLLSTHNNHSNYTDSFIFIDDYYNYSNYKNLSRNLWIYLSPCIFLIGLIGNILILVVMTTSHLKGTSTCTYLKAMAFADLFTLVTGMVPEWLDYMDLLILKEIHPMTCKLEKFSNFCSIDTSIWICVAFTIDRLIAVCFPMAECGVCLPKNVKFHVLLAFLAAVAKNLHVLWTRGAEYSIVTSTNIINPTSNNRSVYKPSSAFITNYLASDNHTVYQLVSNCGSPTPGFKYFETFVRPWMAFVLISLLPFMIIVSCNVLIVRTLLALKLNKNKVPSTNEATSVRQMTVLCLTASICFLVCNTPSIIMLIMKPYWRHTRAYHLAKPFINQIFFINHSANFFLYCITGKRFREALKRVFTSSSHQYTLPSKLPLLSQTPGRFKRRKISSFNIPILFASLKNSKDIANTKK